MNIPTCCRLCVHIDIECDEEFGDSASCDLGIWFPTKKQTCKQQKPLSKAAKEALEE